MDLPLDLSALLRAQDGVVNRRQLRAAGLTKPQVETLLRRRSLTTVHPGVYVDHTGPLSYAQRCWAAVLYAGRSALQLCRFLETAKERFGRTARPAPEAEEQEP